MEQMKVWWAQLQQWTKILARRKKSCSLKGGDRLMDEIRNKKNKVFSGEEEKVITIWKYIPFHVFIGIFVKM